MTSASGLLKQNLLETKDKKLCKANLESGDDLMDKYCSQLFLSVPVS